MFKMLELFSLDTVKSIKKCKEESQGTKLPHNNVH
jgi:hypothetical protein